MKRIEEVEEAEGLRMDPKTLEALKELRDFVAGEVQDAMDSDFFKKDLIKEVQGFEMEARAEGWSLSAFIVISLGVPLSIFSQGIFSAATYIYAGLAVAFGLIYKRERSRRKKRTVLLLKKIDSLSKMLKIATEGLLSKRKSS